MTLQSLHWINYYRSTLQFYYVFSPERISVSEPVGWHKENNDCCCPRFHIPQRYTLAVLPRTYNYSTLPWCLSNVCQPLASYFMLSGSQIILCAPSKINFALSYIKIRIKPRCPTVTGYKRSSNFGPRQYNKYMQHNTS